MKRADKLNWTLTVILHIALAIGIMGCRSGRKGALEEEKIAEMEQLALSQAGAEYKFHRMAAYTADVLQEAVQMDSDSAAINHLRTFLDENDFSLRLINNEIDFWLRNLNQEERNEFVMRLLAKPYADRLRRLEATLNRRFQARPDHRETLGDIIHLVTYHR